jgi:methionine-rich copper-binding protein CopC
VKRGLAALVGLLLVLAGVLLGAPAAQAHNVLQSTDPAADSTVPVMPEVITLTFNEPVLGVGTTIMVHTFDQTMVNTGPPILLDNTVSQAVTGELPAGEYTVIYRVTSADGHPIEGEYRFTAAEATSYGVVAPVPEPSPTASPSPTTSASASASPSPTSVPPSSEARVSGPVLAAVAAALLVVGGVVAWLLLRRREPTAPPAGAEPGGGTSPRE